MKRHPARRSLFLFPIAGLLAISCAGSRQSEDARTAKAEISGYLPNTQAGTLWFTDEGSKGTRIKGEIAGLLPNRKYGMHVHEYGNCSTPEASGEHFDPISANQHGIPGSSPAQRHAGDLPNVQTDDNGRAKVDIATHLLGTGTSDFSLIGKSIVIHAEEDDYQTQPSGGSGQKIACGVITRAEG
jgi:superoxide dismutase, Cu-Zn family